MSGGAIHVDGGISSQFISALMMVAPRLEGGLRMQLLGDVVSMPYIRMTLELMRAGGIRADLEGREIRVEEGPYRFGDFSVESDWSGSSYWFQVAALLPGSDIFLPHLRENSLQGDAVLVDLFGRLGVESSFRDGGLSLKSGRGANRSLYRQDFTACPDLVQTCAATLCALGIPFHFTGTRTLRVKETDRIAALQSELGKLGFPLEADERGDRLSWNGKRGASQDDVLIQTYHDHRMAMAFAPLSVALGPLAIDDPLVVSKSYPRYWEDLSQAGFTVSEP
jgi:3-phosphoshikimate 1-carboxyvinyltransferase